MSEANITKQAFAHALKELLNEKSFSKINVAGICEKCNMNRKSFYYHFKDKYDLVNWIFDTEIIRITKDAKDAKDAKDVTDYGTREIVSLLSNYFYENREFYRRVLRVSGQNSFQEHFWDLMAAALRSRISSQFQEEQVSRFQLCFLTDGVTMAFQRWILDADCCPPEEFLKQLRLSMRYISFCYDEWLRENGE
ncbi:MAG: TetR/AcrR family transcriptional regulator C-terminal domain-containing protein [Candidatus Faecivicinus sp.]